MSAATGAVGGAAAPRLRATAALPWWLAAAAAVVALPLLRAIQHTDADVSWLVLAAGRMLDGAVPYRDIIEPNPPASILLYVPAVLLARLSGLAPATAVDLLVTGLMIGALGLATGMLRAGGLVDGAGRARLCALAVPILLWLPLGSFAQREHVALGALLPILAAVASRLRGRAPALPGLVGAGLLAGAALAIKPIFGLALAGPALLLLRRRGWRVAVAAPEFWLAGALALAYAAAVALLMPDYARRMLPLLVDVYLPARTPLADLIVLPTAGMWLALMASFWQLTNRDDGFGRALALASAGFLACYFIQGKGFPYHGLPAVAVATMACANALAGRLGRREDAVRLMVGLGPAAVALAIAVGQYGYQVRVPRLAPGLIEAVRAAAPHPRILAVGTWGELGAGLAEDVEGTYVGRSPTSWVTLYASLIALRPEQDARFTGLIRAEQARYAEDITRERPDAILVENEEWLGWTTRQPALAAAFARYAPAGRFGTVLLFRPRPTGEAAP